MSANTSDEVALRLRYKGDPHPDRINFEHWYVGNAWLDMHPIGSQKCGEQWEAWLAAKEAQSAELASLRARLLLTERMAEALRLMVEDHTRWLTSGTIAAVKGTRTDKAVRTAVNVLADYGDAVLTAERAKEGETRK